MTTPHQGKYANYAAMIVVLTGSAGFIWAVIHGQFELMTASGAFTGSGLYLLFGRGDKDHHPPLL